MTFKLSPSTLNLMKECPRCFWLQIHKVWKRPAGIFPSLPSGMDKILKVHFDKFMEQGKLPPEILKEVNESEIADYTLLQELRNEGFKSKWKKYGFLKDTWAFVPNPDEVSKDNGYVARFYVDSDCAVLNCYRDSDYSDSSLGVFLIKRL